MSKKETEMDAAAQASMNHAIRQDAEVMESIAKLVRLRTETTAPDARGAAVSPSLVPSQSVPEVTDIDPEEQARRKSAKQSNNPK